VAFDSNSYHRSSTFLRVTRAAKLLVGAAPAEHIPDLIKIVRQEFAGEIHYQRLAEVKVPLAGDRDVFLLVLDVVRYLLVEFVQGIGAPIDLARPPAQEGLVRADAGAADEFEREFYVRKAGRHLVG
jgi:hypothetical protein